MLDMLATRSGAIGCKVLKAAAPLREALIISRRVDWTPIILDKALSGELELGTAALIEFKKRMFKSRNSLLGLSNPMKTSTRMNATQYSHSLLIVDIIRFSSFSRSTRFVK